MLGVALVLVGCLFRLALLVPWAIERLKESDQCLARSRPCRVGSAGFTFFGERYWLSM